MKIKIKRQQYEHFINGRTHYQVIFRSFTASHVDIIYNIHYVIFLFLWEILEGHRLKQRPAIKNYYHSICILRVLGLYYQKLGFILSLLKVGIHFITVYIIEYIVIRLLYCFKTTCTLTVLSENHFILQKEHNMPQSSDFWI